MNSPRTFWQSFLLIGLLLSVLAFHQTIQQANAMRVIILESKWVYLLVLFAMAGLVSAGAAVYLFSQQDRRFFEHLDVKVRPGFFWKAVGGLAVVVSLIILYLFRYRLLGGLIPQAGPTLWLLWWLTLAVSAVMKLGHRRSWSSLFAVAFLSQGVVMELASFLPAISTYPFSMGWSEASRYYYGSLIFASRLYGETLPLSILHPTRYILQSIPFVVDGLPIWVHRLWQVMLWTGITAVTGVLFVRRLRLGDGLLGAIVAMWFFLYLLQGAVYYHLQIMIWIILAGVSMKHPGRSLAAVILASVWAGMSRVNWFPMPAILAVGLFLLEAPVKSYKNIWHYLGQPALWSILGMLTALASQSLYIYLSGNGDNLAAFGSSFTSDLLWERLWSNATYPLGVVPGIAIVSAPMIAVLVYALRGRLFAWHPVRLLGLGAMLVILLAGGLVVSVKIGGGGDLHNMDAFLTLLGIVAGYLFFERAVLENPVPARPPSVLIGFLSLLVPVGFAILSVSFPEPRDYVRAVNDLQALREIVGQAVSEGDEVLFINQRHLLADKSITGVPLVPEYEQIILMEMAMSNNRPYLEQFYQDLKSHRYGLIVTSGQNTDFQPPENAFAAENNTWAVRVARPLLCEYQVETALSGGLVLMTPRESSACP